MNLLNQLERYYNSGYEAYTLQTKQVAYIKANI